MKMGFYVEIDGPGKEHLYFSTLDEAKSAIQALHPESRRLSPPEPVEDKPMRAINQYQELPVSFQKNVDEWLKANKLTPDKLIHGYFPLGYVNRLIDLLDRANIKIKQLEGTTEPFNPAKDML